MAMNMQTTIKELVEVVFYIWFDLKLYKKNIVMGLAGHKKTHKMGRIIISRKSGKGFH
jgi:hypothetical protein